MMSIFGLTIEQHYPVFGALGDARAMTAEEIKQMQLNQAAAQQQACKSLSYLSGMAQYQPPQRPLDERFADFKVRLKVAIDKRANITPNQAGS